MTVPRQRSRRILFVLGVFLLVPGYFAWQWHFWWRRPPGMGEVGITIRREAFSNVWTEREVLLVGLGDSVTAGFGASPGKSYFERLVKNPPDEFPELREINLSKVLPRIRATNLSVSGSTSLHHARTQVGKVPRQGNNVLGLVVFTTGGNDLIHAYGKAPPVEGAMFGATAAQARPWRENVSRRLAEMVATVTNRFPGGCHVFLANIYDPTDGLGDVEKAGLPPWPDGLLIHREYNQTIADYVSRHGNVHLVDIHSAFMGHGIHCTQFWRSCYQRTDPHYWFHPNLEDPNDRGYDALRRLFLNAISEVMARPSSSGPKAPDKDG